MAAAREWGEWARIEQRARERLACLAAESEQKTLDPAATQQAAKDFRYERDLVTADEMKEWLAKWGLTNEDWTAYIQGSLLRMKLRDRLPSIVESYRPDDAQLDRAVWAEAVCSGDLERLARSLAERVAVHQASLTGADGAEAATEGTSSHGGGERETEGTGRPSVATLDADLERFREQVLDPKAVGQRISMHQLDWTKIDARYLSFPQEEMAKEAFLGLSEDGLDVVTVAKDANTEVHEIHQTLDQFSGSLRDQLMGAQKGQVVGPVAVDDQFLVYLIDDKILPSHEDEDVANRASEAVVAAALERRVVDHIQWVWKS